VTGHLSLHCQSAKVRVQQIKIYLESVRTLKTQVLPIDVVVAYLLMLSVACFGILYGLSHMVFEESGTILENSDETTQLPFPPSKCICTCVCVCVCVCVRTYMHIYIYICTFYSHPVHIHAQSAGEQSGMMQRGVLQNYFHSKAFSNRLCRFQCWELLSKTRLSGAAKGVEETSRQYLKVAASAADLKKTQESNTN
jgi:hypothetical protein